MNKSEYERFISKHAARFSLERYLSEANIGEDYAQALRFIDYDDAESASVELHRSDATVYPSDNLGTLLATIARSRNQRSRALAPSDRAPVKCGLCRDTGVVDAIDGRWTVAYQRGEVKAVEPPENVKRRESGHDVPVVKVWDPRPVRYAYRCKCSAGNRYGPVNLEDLQKRGRRVLALFNPSIHYTGMEPDAEGSTECFRKWLEKSYKEPKPAGFDESLAAFDKREQVQAQPKPWALRKHQGGPNEDGLSV